MALTTGFVKGVHGVRYQVKDVARAVAFYTTHLQFTLEHQQLPAFASFVTDLSRYSASMKGPGSISATRWNQVRAAGRYSSSLPMAIPSS